MARNCFRSVLIKWPRLLCYTLTKEPDDKDNNKMRVNLFKPALKKEKTASIYQNTRRKYGAFHTTLYNKVQQNWVNEVPTAPK